MADKFFDLNGEIRLQGTLVAPGGLLPAGGTTGQVLTKASNADGDADWETGGGYTAPITRAVYSGMAVTVNDGADGFLTLDSLQSGDALLDITTPATPTVVTTGVYSFALGIGVDTSMTATGCYRGRLRLVGGSDEVDLFMDSSSATANNDSPRVALTAAWYLAAGDTLALKVSNLDGVQANDFKVRTLAVQRIS